MSCVTARTTTSTVLNIFWNVLSVYSTLFCNEFRREKDKESCGIIYPDVGIGKQGENRSKTFNSKFLYVIK